MTPPWERLGRCGTFRRVRGSGEHNPSVCACGASSSPERGAFDGLQSKASPRRGSGRRMQAPLQGAQHDAPTATRGCLPKADGGVGTSPQPATLRAAKNKRRGQDPALQNTRKPSAILQTILPPRALQPSKNHQGVHASVLCLVFLYFLVRKYQRTFPQNRTMFDFYWRFFGPFFAKKGRPTPALTSYSYPAPSRPKAPPGRAFRA